MELGHNVQMVCSRQRYGGDCHVAKEKALHTREWCNGVTKKIGYKLEQRIGFYAVEHREP